MTSKVWTTRVHPRKYGGCGAGKGEEVLDVQVPNLTKYCGVYSIISV